MRWGKWEIVLMRTWSRAIRTSDWPEGSAFKRIAKTTPAKALTWTQSNILRGPEVAPDGLHPTWQSTKRSAERNDRKSPKSRCAKLLVSDRGKHCQRSCNYWVKGQNTTYMFPAFYSRFPFEYKLIIILRAVVIRGYWVHTDEVEMNWKDFRSTRQLQFSRQCILYIHAHAHLSTTLKLQAIDFAIVLNTFTGYRGNTANEPSLERLALLAPLHTANLLSLSLTLMFVHHRIS